MAKKKKYHLKTWPKVLLFLIIVLSIGGYYSYQKYQEYLYTKTDEYALLELGYTKKDVSLIEKKLTDRETKEILKRGYDEFIPMFLNTKYFIYENLDGYLSQVISQDEDFFKYHGTEGYDYNSIVALVNVSAHTPYYENVKDTDLTKEYSILVNKYNELGSEYAPDDLVDIPIKYRFAGTKKIRQVVFDAFLEMWEAAYAEGIYLIVDSGYRGYKAQAEVYKYYQDLKGLKYADSIAARPGFSEHQTGLSLDLYSKECSSAKNFKDSKTYAWLIKNAHKYGFILRYPEGKDKITGYGYESWHYRYLGKELATSVYQSGLTYDEYYAYYIENNN